jgi:hypothetical protein
VEGVASEDLPVACVEEQEVAVHGDHNAIATTPEGTNGPGEREAALPLPCTDVEEAKPPTGVIGDDSLKPFALFLRGKRDIVGIEIKGVDAEHLKRGEFKQVEFALHGQADESEVAPGGEAHLSCAQRDRAKDLLLSHVNEGDPPLDQMAHDQIGAGGRNLVGSPTDRDLAYLSKELFGGFLGRLSSGPGGGGSRGAGRRCFPGSRRLSSRQGKGKTQEEPPNKDPRRGQERKNSFYHLTFRYIKGEESAIRLEVSGEKGSSSHLLHSEILLLPC